MTSRRRQVDVGVYCGGQTAFPPQQLQYCHMSLRHLIMLYSKRLPERRKVANTWQLTQPGSPRSAQADAAEFPLCMRNFNACVASNANFDKLRALGRVRVIAAPQSV